MMVITIYDSVKLDAQFLQKKTTTWIVIIPIITTDSSRLSPSFVPLKPEELTNSWVEINLKIDGGRKWRKKVDGASADSEFCGVFDCCGAGWLGSRQTYRWRTESSPRGWESFDDDICVARWYDGAILGVSGIHANSCLEQCWTCKCCNIRYYLMGDYCSCFWSGLQTNHSGRTQGKRLQTLKAFVAISGLSQLVYLLLLHAGVFKSRYG
ncbi:uncharacterized protein [Primulina eburnea]|uniref:uncharacterized protein isoform X1 n=1 Tax=Primulina eburnea TaxID=1245227 RepID=UPI003C6C6222